MKVKVTIQLIHEDGDTDNSIVLQTPHFKDDNEAHAFHDAIQDYVWEYIYQEHGSGTFREDE